MDTAEKIALEREHLGPHWWDGHPPADSTAEPLYTAVLESHLAESA